MIDPVPFATYSFVMWITPGPNNVMLTASGAHFGLRRTLPHMLGICAGFALQMLAACAGLGALFSRWPQLQGTLRWLGAAYLLYLGWQLLRPVSASERHVPRPLTLPEAAAFQFLNPKAWVINLTAATLFLPHELTAIAAAGYMLAVGLLLPAPSIVLWVLFGTSLRALLARRAGRLAFNCAMALALAGTAVMMLI
ncbi:MAG TPA: LysE family translocator [Steroidobacteraceae bacterium]|jgi:threonine/homoserine/homoserine lactone efflux protein|nr:LysE family translocator [Steroidobacteraceae bacterium]